ncbi:MAG: YIP1 family protein [Alphaproteobacteria bacterium]|nr:YIP1 family protein [Alphaproteobacteria bacterium]
MSLANDARVNTIINRVKNLITKPEAEWDVIAGESATIQGLYKNYAMILAAIPAAVGFLVIVMRAPSAIGHALLTLIAGYILALLGIAVLAFIVDFLAPKFKGTSNQISAFKLAIYAATPAWAAGLFLIIPVIGAVLMLVGVVYSLYLFFLGVPKLMKCPKDQAVIFTVVALVVNVVVQVCLRALV